MRVPILIALVIAAAAVAGCGGGEAAKPAAGTPGNPLVAEHVPETTSGRSNESRPSVDAPGYAELLQRQSGSSQRRFTPCNLVTRSQAQAILGGGVQTPVEAPQGPTCIYRSETGKTFITLAVQSLEIGDLKRRVDGRRDVAMGDRKAICGFHGTPVLYAPLQGGRVLSISAPCAVAKQFAARALSRLDG